MATADPVPAPAIGERDALAKQVRGSAATDAILNATHDLLMEGGYGAATIEAVAERAGVARATIYRRWPSKQALVAAAARRGLQTDLVIPDVGSFREELRLYLMTRLSWFRSGEATRGIEGLMAAVGEDPSLSETIASGTDLYTSPMTPVVERGIAAGEVRPDVDHRLVVALSSGPLVFLNIFNRQVPDIALVDQVVDMVVRAVRPATADDDATTIRR